MSDELYDNLRRIYEDFFLERKTVMDNKNNNDNENYSQNYDIKINILDSKIKTISSLLNMFERCIFTQKYNENCDLGLKTDKETINNGLKILDIQEKERQRIARDLHDTTLQSLTHLIHKIELSSMYIDQDIIKAKLELAGISRNLKTAIQEMRNTIFDLRPMTFDDLGLKESFERLADHLRENSDFDIYYNVEEINCNNSLILITIFRIIEECANNAIKHSGGSVVFFELKKITNDNCIVIISDDGNGFDSEKILSEKDKHFGLTILKERVNLLSGNIEIDSKPGKGTVIKIIIPLLDN